MLIFESDDRDGDRCSITDDVMPEDGVLAVTVVEHGKRSATVYLSEHDLTSLLDAGHALLLRRSLARR